MLFSGLQNSTLLILLLPALMALSSTTLDSKMFYKRQETTPIPITYKDLIIIINYVRVVMRLLFFILG